MTVDDSLDKSVSPGDEEEDEGICEIGKSDKQPSSPNAPTAPGDVQIVKDHPLNQIIGDPSIGVKTRRQFEAVNSHLCFT